VVTGPVAMRSSHEPIHNQRLQDEDMVAIMLFRCKFNGTLEVYVIISTAICKTARVQGLDPIIPSAKWPTLHKTLNLQFPQSY